HTIKEEVVIQRARAARAKAESSRITRAWLADCHADGKLCQLDRIAAVQRKAHHRPTIDNLPGLRRVGLKQRRGVADHHFLADRAHLERRIHPLALLHVERDWAGDGLLESTRRNRDLIRSNANRADAPTACGIALCAVDIVCAGIY